MGIFTFPYRGALTTSVLNGVENRTGPALAVVPDTLMGVSRCLSTFTSDKLLNSRLLGIREESDHTGKTVCRAFPEGDFGYVHGQNDTRESVVVWRPLSEAARSIPALQTKRSIKNVLYMA